MDGPGLLSAADLPASPLPDRDTVSGPQATIAQCNKRDSKAQREGDLSADPDDDPTDDPTADCIICAKHVARDR
jgi:phage-related protein